MIKDFSELVEYLDKKFARIDKKFFRIDERFTEIDERFTKIDGKLINIDGKLIDIDEKTDELNRNKADKEDINKLMNSVDAYAGKADTYFQEMVMLSHKVDKLEKWVNRIAKKVGIKLEE